MLSKGNILCFPDARRGEERDGGGQPSDVVPLLQAVACSVVSTRGPGAAATAAREETMQRESCDSKEGQPVDQERRAGDTQLPFGPSQETEPQQAGTSLKGRETSSGHGVNQHAFPCVSYMYTRQNPNH